MIDSIAYGSLTFAPELVLAVQVRVLHEGICPNPYEAAKALYFASLTQSALPMTSLVEKAAVEVWRDRAQILRDHHRQVRDAADRVRAQVDRVRDASDLIVSVEDLRLLLSTVPPS